MIKFIALLMVVGMPMVAFGQSDQNERKEIYLSVDVGYNTAYREKSWVPVNVNIQNEQADLEGILEIRTYDSQNQIQSPIYHLPVNCPKDSKKRFTLLAYIDGSVRLDARLLENGRPAMDTAPYVTIKPIKEGDLMGIILDDDPLNYSFLNMSIQSRNSEVRLHRYALMTKDLAYLPNHIMALEAFNFIIIGSIDASRVSTQQRELIRQYAESGGVVIVMTGLNGNRFRGTWVEELGGVQLGASEDINEVKAAQALFGDTEGSEARNEIVLTKLTTSDETVLLSVGDQPLVSKRVLGEGSVYTLAVDTDTHAFQAVNKYRTLWAKMMFDKAHKRSLNIEFFNSSAAQLIPNHSGVNVRSLGFVVLYLFLYVGVGIIGNWLFWNYRKRREMAWVCLVVFSVCFSAYAYVSGTAGWTKVAEKQQIDVVHIKPGSTQSDYYGLSGILTARTRNYTAKQQGTNYLIKDVNTSMNPYGYYQNRRDRTPFVFLQGDEPGLRRFTVGASELRFASLEGKLEQNGVFSGTLELTEEGIQGTIVNETPYAITDYALLYEGALHPVRIKGDQIEIDISASVIEQRYHQELNENGNNQWTYYNFRGESATFQILRKALFVGEQDYLVQKNYPPTLVGWTETLVSDSLVIDREMIDTLHKTLVVAELPLKDMRGGSESDNHEEDLLVRVNDLTRGGSSGRGISRSGYQEQGVWAITDINNAFHESYIYGNHQVLTEIANCEIRIPLRMINDKSSALELTLYRELSEKTEEYSLLLNHGSTRTSGWSEAHWVSTDEVELGGRPVQRIRYHIDDLTKLPSHLGNEEVRYFTLLGKSNETNTTDYRNEPLRYTVTAKGINTNKKDNTGDWLQWQ